MYIKNTIMQYPRAVDIPCEPFGYRTVSWRDFSRDNPEIADDVAIQIAVKGSAVIGGGAAPFVILRGK